MSRIKLPSSFFLFALFLIGCAKDSEQQQENHAPVAAAGNDTTIVLPANTIILNGSLSTDPDNNIKSYQWIKISGPLCNIVNANAAQTQVNNLIAGAYVFELKVIDASDLFDKDTMQVNVTNAAVNVYVAGAEVVSGKRFAKYWKNGLAVNLTDGSNAAEAEDIVVVNNDVYVAGSENKLGWSNTTWPVPKYWKNGTAVTLPYTGTYAIPSAIAVVNNDVYVAGEENFPSNVRVAKYWKNGVAVNLTNGNFDASAYAIAIANNDVYVSGVESNSSGKQVAKYWKNGVAVSLTDGNGWAFGNDIVVVNNDVYVAGFEDKSGAVVAKYCKKRCSSQSYQWQQSCKSSKYYYSKQ